MIKEFHYSTEEENYELPSGAIDPGETPLEAAKKELKEETGLLANSWTDLGYVSLLTVVLNAPNYIVPGGRVNRG